MIVTTRTLQETKGLLYKSPYVKNIIHFLYLKFVKSYQLLINFFLQLLSKKNNKQTNKQKQKQKQKKKHRQKEEETASCIERYVEIFSIAELMLSSGWSFMFSA